MIDCIDILAKDGLSCNPSGMVMAVCRQLCIVDVTLVYQLEVHRIGD